jgi:hypothetical protein
MNNISLENFRFDNELYPKYLEYKCLYFDNNYIVISDTDNFFIAIYANTNLKNFGDYINEEPIFYNGYNGYNERNWYCRFEEIINDVLIITYGTVSPPKEMRLIDLKNGKDLLDSRDGYYFTKLFNENKICKYIGSEIDERMKNNIFDIENYNYQMKLYEMSEGGGLAYYEIYIVSHKIKAV